MNADRYSPPDPLPGISDENLELLGRFIATHMGLNFPRKQWNALQRGVSSAARDFGFDNPESCVRWIVSSSLSKEQIEILASHLTVGETYFLREKRSLQVFRERLVPQLISTRSGSDRCLRIWSAGCASGEEPFSIAIILNELCAVLRGWTISILATDINPLALRKAAEGIYGEWSFRNPPRGFKEKYFRKRGAGRYEVLPHIREMVSFAYLNLAEDVYPSLLNNTNALDVIFCRNVLMYFTPDRARTVADRLHRSLKDGGWLFVSPCETSTLLFSQFNAVGLPDAALYQKGGSKEQRPSPIRPFPVSPVQEPFHVPAPPVPDLPQPPRIEPPPVRAESAAPYEEALALYERGLYPEAEEKIAAFLPSGRIDTRATVLLCRIRANQGKLGDARKLLEEAITADKLTAELHYLRAMVLQEEGALGEATASLNRALYLDQDMVLAHFSLGNLALRQGKNREAARHFENTLALLGRYREEEILPESEGMSAGRLAEMIRSIGMMGDRDENQRIHAR